MNIFSEIAGAYLRWRHSRGFGVHSPFAYGVVTTAVSPGPYGYYGYALIEEALLAPDAKGLRRMRGDARLLLRLLVCLGSRRLLLLTAAHPAFQAAAEGAGVDSVRFRPKKDSLRSGDFALLKGKWDDTATVASLLGSGTAVMAIEPSLEMEEAIAGSMSDGLLLQGKRITVGIPREGMRFVSYSIKF